MARAARTRRGSVNFMIVLVIVDWGLTGKVGMQEVMDQMWMRVGEEGKQGLFMLHCAVPGIEIALPNW